MPLRQDKCQNTERSEESQGKCYLAGVETFEQFKELDDREFVQSGDYKKQVETCLELSNIVIENDGSVSDLAQKVDVALARTQE